MKWALRLTAVFLWYFTPIYILTLLGAVTNLSFRGYSFVRQPYQWDFELMFAVFFLVWGIFIWRASHNPLQYILFIHFTAWALLTHALVMISLGILRAGEFIHFFIDSIPYFVLGILLFIKINRKYTNYADPHISN